MKKLFLLSIFTILIVAQTGCTKTDVENDLEQERLTEDPIPLTDEEMAVLDQEDVDFQQDYLEALAEATEDQKMDEYMDLINDIEDSKSDKKSGTGVVGSCNDIADSSTCLEYYGSFWNSAQAELNCSAQGVFSTDPCPRDFAGGCNTGVGTPADMVAWMYLYGGGELTAESLGYAKMACDATLASNWVE